MADGEEPIAALPRGNERSDEGQTANGLTFYRPLRGLGILFLSDPGVARCALTPGYFVSRLRRENNDR
jgi:hypothetical protein